ncbi:MAG: hydrogenase maturation nickel metallochaperone HypA [Planctomycetota bacterium]|nr:hydrogenase maturation nickel metallochaperone HypA [Planctomycetota bacterium]
MHELSIAINLVDQLMDLVKQHNASGVETVALRVGALSHVDFEAMEDAFTEASRDTVAEGASLQMTETPAVMECLDCCERFESKDGNFACPHCRQANTRVIEGEDILLMSVEMREKQGDI